MCSLRRGTRYNMASSSISSNSIISDLSWLWWQDGKSRFLSCNMFPQFFFFFFFFFIYLFLFFDLSVKIWQRTYLKELASINSAQVAIESNIILTLFRMKHARVRRLLFFVLVVFWKRARPLIHLQLTVNSHSDYFITYCIVKFMTWASSEKVSLNMRKMCGFTQAGNWRLRNVASTLCARWDLFQLPCM